MSTQENDMTQRPYRIVVGVSATSGSPTALQWAARQAEAFGGEIVAVRAWKAPSPQAGGTVPSAGRVPTAESVQTQHREGLERAVTAALGDDHDARLELVQGGKRKVLLQAARNADLLVVDAPRAHTARPFAPRLVYAAPCPVVVMPPRISGEPPTMVARAASAVGRSALRGTGTAGRPGYRPA